MKKPKKRGTSQKTLTGRYLIDNVLQKVIVYLKGLLMGYSHANSLPDIMEEIAKEDEEKHNRHLRRVVAKQERLKTRPPRFGKYKYVNAN